MSNSSLPYATANETCVLMSFCCVSLEANDKEPGGSAGEKHSRRYARHCKGGKRGMKLDAAIFSSSLASFVMSTSTQRHRKQRRVPAQENPATALAKRASVHFYSTNCALILRRRRGERVSAFNSE
ncbi:UNVERIFIED_CONTAM: hypothetical protein K2H54_016103 [Gekko kuhli]